MHLEGKQSDLRDLQKNCNILLVWINRNLRNVCELDSKSVRPGRREHNFIFIWVEFINMGILEILALAAKSGS